MAKKSEFPPSPNVSKTSIATFDECERKYALSYLPHFELPPAMARDVRFQKKLLDGHHAIAGQVVDDVITTAFREFREEGWPADYMSRARAVMDEYRELSREWWVASHARLDPPAAHRQPLYRYYFELGIPKGQLAEMKEIMRTCLEAFWRSKLLRELLDAGPVRWELPPPGTSPWFMDGEVPVYAKFDFILRTDEGIVIYDWKTGSPKDLEARRQLNAYAAYAMAKWALTEDRIRLAAVWLKMGPDQYAVETVNAEVLAELRRSWGERHALLRERAKEARQGPGQVLDLFPMTGFDKGRCRWCSFRCCEGYERTIAMDTAASGSLDEA